MVAIRQACREQAEHEEGLGGGLVLDIISDRVRQEERVLEPHLRQKGGEGYRSLTTASVPLASKAWWALVLAWGRTSPRSTAAYTGSLRPQ